MARRRLLFHQLLALAAASLLLAAFPVHATPDDASAAEYSGAPLLHAASPARATPPSPDDASAADPGAPLVVAVSPVHATPPPNRVVIPRTAAVFRDARRLGPPRHLLLSDVPADAEAPAPAAAPAPRRFYDNWIFLGLLLILELILAAFWVWVLVRVVSWLLDHVVPLVTSFVADHYAAARRWLTAARNKASGRVRPLDQDAVAGAGP